MDQSVEHRTILGDVWIATSCFCRHWRTCGCASRHAYTSVTAFSMSPTYRGLSTPGVRAMLGRRHSSWPAMRSRLPASIPPYMRCSASPRCPRRSRALRVAVASEVERRSRDKARREAQANKGHFQQSPRLRCLLVALRETRVMTGARNLTTEVERIGARARFVVSAFDPVSQDRLEHLGYLGVGGHRFATRWFADSPANPGLLPAFRRLGRRDGAPKRAPRRGAVGGGVAGGSSTCPRQRPALGGSPKCRARRARAGDHAVTA